MFDSFTQDNRLAISRFYCFWFVLNRSLNVKKFSRIVCVSLFSYQGFSLCLSDSSFILSYLFLFVKYFFQVFSNFFELRFCCRFVDDLDTLSFFQLFQILFLMNLCLADSLFTLSCLQAFVNKFFHFFEKFIFFKKITEKEGFEPSRRVSDLYP